MADRSKEAESFARDALRTVDDYDAILRWVKWLDDGWPQHVVHKRQVNRQRFMERCLNNVQIEVHHAWILLRAATIHGVVEEKRVGTGKLYRVNRVLAREAYAILEQAQEGRSRVRSAKSANRVKTEEELEAVLRERGKRWPI